MKKIIIFLFIVLVVAMAVGFYLRYDDQMVMGDRVIGLTILTAVFVLMPLFLYHRWKNRKVKDYMLSEENIRKMQDYSNGKKPDNQ